MRGGCRTTCDLEARSPKSSYSPPRGGCEAAVALPATLKPEGRSLPTCRLAVDARRLSHFLRRSSPEEEVALSIGPEFIEGRSRSFCRLAVDARRLSHYCDLEARSPKSSYSPHRRGCEAAVALPATWMPGCRCRHTCLLAVDARRPSSYLLPRRGCEAAVALPATWMPGCRCRHTCCLAEDARRLSHNLRLLSPKAEVVLPAASSWMRGGCRTICDFEAQKPKSYYLLPRRVCEAAVASPATLKPACRSHPTCRPGVDLRRQSVTCRLALEITEGVCRRTCRLDDHSRRQSRP